MLNNNTSIHKLSWLERKKAALCILLAILSVSVYIIVNSNNKINDNKGNSYVVKIKHYGINAEEMENTITIPLEDALFAIPGVHSTISSSENSVSSVFVRFKSNRSISKKGRYEAVRDAAQRVYETLPSSAQRPEILKSDNSRIPVWSGVVYSDNQTSYFLEKIIKPRFESLEGAGEVIVSGVGNKQILINLNQEKISFLGIDASMIASVLARNDSVFSAGTILQKSISTNIEREIIITVDGRQRNIEESLIPLGEGRFITLKDIAVITENERDPDILSRLNGKKTAGIAIMSKDGANLQKLSNEIKKELSLIDLPFEFIVLSDLGAEETKAFQSVLNAALIAAFMVAGISYLLNANMIRGLVCAGFIPVILIISAAFLSVTGISINKLMLAGLAAGVGTAVDAVVLSSEKLRMCRDFSSAKIALGELRGQLTAGTTTTVIALIPLIGISDESIKIIAISIAVVCVIALIIALIFLPPLILIKFSCKNKSVQQIKFSKRVFYRILAKNIKFCTQHPLIVAGIAVVFTFASIFTFFSKGVDTSSYGSESSVYAQVEFKSGLLKDEVDLLLASYSTELLKTEGIINVETGARTGSASLLISFDPKIINNNDVKYIAKQILIPGGFVFFHENSNKDRYWEIKVYGDKDSECRKIAEEIAFLCTNHIIVKDCVLNFKQGSQKLTLIPDREIFSKVGISFSKAANQVRQGVYGPVAYKKISGFDEGEVDVRIFSGNNSSISSREEIFNLLVSGTGGALHIDTLMKTLEKDEFEPSKIRRDDRRRCASITIITNPGDPRRIKKELNAVFQNIYLPSGYSIEFDPTAIEEAEKISKTIFSLILAIIFCYMIIASISESFISPLIVLAAIPPSLSFPALLLGVSGSTFNLAIACAQIAVSGMTVNAAVLCVSELRKRNSNKEVSVYLAIRKKIPALLATGATTIAGALPFLFLKESSNTIIRTLSVVGAAGVLCSCVCAITLIPAIFILINSKLGGKYV